LDIAADCRSFGGPKGVKKFTVETSKGRFKMQGLAQEVGQDLLVSIWGGTRAHIGVVGVATPSPCLKYCKPDPATLSKTISLFGIVEIHGVHHKIYSERLK
jgi:hypothetical protein